MQSRISGGSLSRVVTCAVDSTGAVNLPRTDATCVLSNPFSVQQCRHYTPPSKRTWSRQHYKIKFPRPLTDPFYIQKLVPKKQWWREKRMKPETFMGFPDVTKIGVRGGSFYHEQMDPVTLAVVADRLVHEGIADEDIWSKICYRAQQVANKTHEPDLGYIYRALSQIDWYDQHFVATFIGRICRRLHMFQLRDCGVIIEAMANPNFRHEDTLQRVERHMELLLTNRDDHKIEDLALAAASFLYMGSRNTTLLSLIGDALLKNDLTTMDPRDISVVLDAFATLNIPHKDLCWTLIRELKPKLDSCSPRDLARLVGALAELKIGNTAYIEDLVVRVMNVRYTLSPAEVARVTYAFSKLGKRFAPLYESLGHGVKDHINEMTPLDLSRVAFGFLNSGCETKLVEEVVFPRIRAMLPDFTLSALVLLFDGLSRAKTDLRALGALAGFAVKEIHEDISRASVTQLVSIARSCTDLQPVKPEFYQALFERLAVAAKEDRLTDNDISFAMIGLIAQDPQDMPNQLKMMETFIEAAKPMLEEAKYTSLLKMTEALASCPPAFAASQAPFLEAVFASLAFTVNELPPRSLVALTDSLFTLRDPFASTGKEVRRHLLHRLLKQLDMKRYHITPQESELIASRMNTLGAARPFVLERPSETYIKTKPSSRASARVDADVELTFVEADC